MGKKQKKPKQVVTDRHLLYSAAVQSVGIGPGFLPAHLQAETKAPFRLLREDFCGTAMLACEWVRRNRKNRAWGVDLRPQDARVGQGAYVPRLGKAAERLELLSENVLEQQDASGRGRCGAQLLLLRVQDPCAS